jgi:peptide/nickel transport system substrate-binding protein
MKKKRFISMVLFFTLIFVSVFSSGIFAKDTKQELVIAFEQDTISFDMHNYRSGQDMIAGSLVYETLVSFDKDGNIVPKLATSWERIDPLTWKFYLRKGVKFHDGTPFTAEAVKFNIKRCTEGNGAGYTGFIDEVEVVDDYTVLFHLKNEFGPVLNNLTNTIGAMMNPKFVKEQGENISQCACGTGPFKLIEYNRGSGAVFVKNEDYWGKPAKLDRIEFRTIPEDSTRIIALKTGEVDIIIEPPPQELSGIKGDKNLSVYMSPKYRTLSVYFNMLDKNVGGEENRAFREAIAYAINPQEIVDYVLEGLALPLDKGFFPESIIKGKQDPSLIRKPDLEKAKQILKEAGIKPGRTVEFLCTRGRYLRDTETAEVIQSQLAKAGINAKVVVMEMGAYTSAASKHEQEMFLLAWGWVTGDPYQLFYQAHFSSSGWNWGGFYNEEMDKLIEEGGVTMDWDKRMEIFNKAYKILYDNVAIVPILQYNNLYAMNKKVKGFFASPTEMVYFDEVYIEE